MGAFPLLAQHNIYKIDDELFAYQQKCVKVVRQKQALAMADTLFRWAARKDDSKAQCLALHLKVDHYYSNDDLPALKDAVRQLRDFAVKTPHQQYVFSGWNRLITFYLRKMKSVEALAEVQLYQAEAVRLDNPYGLAYAYRHYGNVYRLMRNNKAALNYYRLAAEVLEKQGNKGELSAMYQAMGDISIALGDDETAEQYLKKALDTAPGGQRKMLPILYLARFYSKKGDVKEAGRYLQMHDSLRKEYPIWGGTASIYAGIKTNYYRLAGDYARARICLDSIPETDTYYSARYQLEAATGNYREAYRWLLKWDSLKAKQNSDELNNMLTEYATRFDNTRLEAEKNRLALQNSEMRLRQLADERSLMEADKERDRLNLQAAELKLKNSDLALKQQQSDLERNRTEVLRQKERAAAAEERERMQSTITSVLIIFSGSLIVFIFIYTMQRRKSIVRLQKERNIALRARNEAEELRFAADRARMEADRAREAAEYANQQKSVFLQNMSHEIRTPLNAIVGFSDVVNSEEDLGLTPEERREYLNLIHVNTDLLSTLVNDVLDLSKLESGTYTLTLASVAVGELCRGTLRSIASRVVPGVELKLDEPAGTASTLTLQTDAVRLQQVLTNFLTNACKYTERGSITLKYRPLEDGGVEFSVTDTGSGIPADKAETVFERFEKLNNFKQGTGLGLSICRRIAELVGGRVYVDTAYQAGARFVFVHPELKKS